MAARKAASAPGDRRKATARGAASRAHNGGEARGEGTKGRGRGCATWGGNIGGGRESRSRSGRQAGTTSEKLRRVGVVWVQLLARVYI